MAVLAALGAGVPAGPARPQPASLLADEVTFDSESGTLTASGGVEVLYEGSVLRAERVVYDREADQIRVTGPLTLTDADGSVLLADAAELTPDLEAGLIEGARLLIAGEFQVSALEMQRRSGRYNTLHRTVASSCTICAGNPTPTWSIRARRVTQDEQRQRIYFEDAVVEVLGVPIGYVPNLSVPDPRVRRASGFLLPGYQQSDIYGSGVKLPYYRVLGPSADATVTPFPTTGGAFLLEGEYRRRVSGGGFDLWGVFAVEDGMGDSGRGALATDGSFSLRRGFVGEFDINLASDDDFLQQFDYSDDDRLTSTAQVFRVRPTEYLAVGTVGFQSLREDENSGDVPFVLPEIAWRRYRPQALAGGTLGLEADALGIYRASARDVVRIGGGGDWRRDWLLPRGVLTNATLAADVEAYRTWDDPEFDGSELRAVPMAATEFRWPLVRRTGTASHLVEPIVQLVYSAALGDEQVPNEDSQLPELDEGNLFSLNRFPGRDGVETGLRANVGMQYSRYDPAGWTMDLTFGRVVRAEPDDDFAEGTGLAGRWSDYVAAASLSLDAGLRFSNRALIKDDLQFRRNELALAFDGARTDLEAYYTYLAADDTNPLLGPQPETNAIGIEASYRVHPNWKLRGHWRYDAVSNDTLRAGGGITYGNECAEFDLSVSRRYTSWNNVPPSTSIGFGVRLAGLGEAGGETWPARACAPQGI
jgi:LPS-assembly protein